jgi:23S rRNA (guanosine2251-2'-O)-methyltransferase
LDKVVIHKGMQKADMEKAQALAAAAKVPVELQAEIWFHKHCEGGKHQGLAAWAPLFAYTDLADMLRACKGPSLLVALDQIHDPRNLGAILRSAEALGAQGAFLPKDRACEVTPTVEKTSSGAASRLAVAQVVNLNQALDDVKAAGFWCYGLSLDATEAIESEKFSNKVCLVIGSEAKGLRPLVAQHCDKLLKIGMRGKTQSLNASVAAAIAMYKVSLDIYGKNQLN